MSERGRNSCEQSVLQDRLNWYQVNRFLRDVAQASFELGLRPADIVHIGGISMFYRLYQVYGSSAVMHFRGTRDMDIVSFRQGSIQQLVDRLVNKPGSTVKNAYEGISFGLPDKRRVFFNFREDNIPGGYEEFKVDTYESGTRVIKFNNHQMTEAAIVLDPVEALKLPTYPAPLGVPSLRDAFIIKMDVVDDNKEGKLRNKDKLDILTFLKVSPNLGTRFSDLLAAVAKTSPVESIFKKADQLECLFTHPTENLLLPEEYPYLPSTKELRGATQEVKRLRDSAKRGSFPNNLGTV